MSSKETIKRKEGILGICVVILKDQKQQKVVKIALLQGPVLQQLPTKTYLGWTCLTLILNLWIEAISLISQAGFSG